MMRAQTWYLVILIGLAVMLGGLVWDATIHATEHAHLVVEALLDPANPFENPSHIVIGLGLVWTVIATLLAFTASWLEDKDWRTDKRMLAVPVSLWLVLGLAGMVGLVVIGTTG